MSQHCSVYLIQVYMDPHLISMLSIFDFLPFWRRKTFWKWDITVCTNSCEHGFTMHGSSTCITGFCSGCSIYKTRNHFDWQFQPSLVFQIDNHCFVVRCLLLWPYHLYTFHGIAKINCLHFPLMEFFFQHFRQQVSVLATRKKKTLLFCCRSVSGLIMI